MLYQIRVRFSVEYLEYVLNFFDDQNFEALSWYECSRSEPSSYLDDNGFPIAQWFWIEAMSQHKPDENKLNFVLSLLGKQFVEKQYQIFIEPLDNEDWQQKVYEAIKPFQVRRFYIHHDFLHPKEVENNYKIGLNIRAATAFGSGEHPTTYTCLEALDDIKKQCCYVQSILDMGCGSGILSIAAKKMWKMARVLAIDIDPESVKVTLKNCKVNRVNCDVLQSNGFQNIQIQKQAPYRIIIANILAKPLMEMASLFRYNLCKNGYLVLSGLLQRQANMILNAFKLQGLKLIRVYKKNDWQTIVFQPK